MPAFEPFLKNRSTPLCRKLFIILYSVNDRYTIRQRIVLCAKPIRQSKCESTQPIGVTSPACLLLVVLSWLYRQCCHGRSRPVDLPLQFPLDLNCIRSARRSSRTLRARCAQSHNSDISALSFTVPISIGRKRRRNKSAN